MQSKLLKLFWLNLGLVLLPLAGAQAAITIGPYNVANQVVDNGDGLSSIYYLDSSYPGAAQGAPGYTTHAFTGHEVFEYNIYGADAAQGYLWVYAQDITDSTVYYPVVLSYCTAGAVGTVGRCDSGANTEFRIGIDFTAVCAGTNGANIRGCVGTSVGVAATPIKGFHLRFLSAGVGAPGSTTAATGTFLRVLPQVAAPTVAGLALPGFFPGDSAILLETSGLVAVADPTTGSSPVFTTIWVAAEEGGTVTPGNEMAASTRKSVGYNSGQQEIGGFKNSTSDTQIFYDMRLGVQDSAGAVGFSATDYPKVFSTDIQGFLRESKCFVATASYRDGRAPGVMLLRNFRDEVLANFDLGRDFIGWYYENGPIAADWLIKHPIFRTASLMALIPVQAAAFVALHPAILLLPLVGLIALLGLFAETGALLSLLLVSSLLIAGAASASDQPYIDSLISELPKEAMPTNANPAPYIQSLKSKVGKAEETTGYSEEMKRQLPPRDGSENYTQRLKQGLPAAPSGSAIEDYKNGKKLRANKGALDTRSAFGFNLSASANRTYTAGANQDIAYETVYGNKWVPDFTIHYEWRPFTGSFIKKFGLYSSLGAAFTKAKGVLNYQDPRFGSESKTAFQFISVPFNVGLIYRFSLFDFIWPYFGAGPSAIGFLETRNDKQKNMKGYALGYWGLAGVAFGLDWMSSKSSWDQYESTGVKHSYFTLDYSYLESVSGGLVEFTVDGVQLGFTFEI